MQLVAEIADSLQPQLQAVDFWSQRMAVVCCIVQQITSCSGHFPCGAMLQVMKFAKDSRHECSINVMQVKGVTRAITGGAQQL